MMMMTFDFEKALTDHSEKNIFSKTNTTWSNGWAEDKRGWCTEDQGTDGDSQSSRETLESSHTTHPSP